MPFVVDSSVVLAWLMSDEGTAESDALFQRTSNETILAPTLLDYEVTNVLIVQERRKRLDADSFQIALAGYDALPISFQPIESRWEIVKIARTCGLTYYDASYVRIAAKNSLPIASFDKAMIRAAQQLGIESLISLH